MIELVKKERPEGIWVGDMKDGDVGVIVKWDNSLYLGRIVQRYYNRLVTVGMDGGCSWSEIFINCRTSKERRVRLLEKGETLIVI